MSRSKELGQHLQLLRHKLCIADNQVNMSSQWSQWPRSFFFPIFTCINKRNYNRGKLYYLGICKIVFAKDLYVTMSVICVIDKKQTMGKLNCGKEIAL